MCIGTAKFTQTLMLVRSILICTWLARALKGKLLLGPDLTGISYLCGGQRQGWPCHYSGKSGQQQEILSAIAAIPLLLDVTSCVDSEKAEAKSCRRMCRVSLPVRT